jgi:alpha-beta hydrolase superfamily lysophospholipase
MIEWKKWSDNHYFDSIGGKMQATTFTFKAPNGPEIFVYKWAPDAGIKPKAVVQIAHGAAEHALRYERFAGYLTKAGYVVYANDHRGHGKTAGDLKKAGIAGLDAWNGIMRDMHQLSDIIREEYPGLPFIFFGHSLGSLIAQNYIQNWGNDLKGAVLTGTFGSLGGDPSAIVAMCEQEVQANGDNAPSQVFMGTFANFNQPFQPAKTGFEWLSRDEAEVQKYVDDPWCGFPFSNRFVIDFFKGAAQIWSPENEARIPKDLPLFVASGELDPAGGNGVSVNELVDRYRANGMTDIQVKFYPQARHEILNETNRDEVQQDIRNWMDKLVG